MNWFWKWLGCHVCETFTQWESHTLICTRPATPTEVAWMCVKKIQFTENYQERRCTVCGKTQQQPLKWGGRSLTREEAKEAGL